MSELIEHDARVSEMAISYKKLWKLPINKDMKKKDLGRVAGIAHLHSRSSAKTKTLVLTP